MKNLLSWHHYEVVHIFLERLEIGNINNSFGIVAHDVIRVLHGANMLTGNTYHHFSDFQPRFLLCHFNGGLNAFDSQGDIGDNAALNAKALAFSDA